MSDALRLYVYQNGERMGMVDSSNSLQWAPAFADVGEIKLVCGATATNRAMLVQGAVLYNPDTPGLAALIVATELDSDARKLTVRGKFTLQRFAQRIAKGKTTVTDAAAGLLDLCRANLRELEVALPDAADFTAPCEAVDLEWVTCLDAMTQLAETGGFGLRCAFDPATGSETLELLQGKDRSAPGSDLYMGYFSTRMQNLSSPTYTEDASDYANVVLCGGEEPSEGGQLYPVFLRGRRHHSRRQCPARAVGGRQQRKAQIHRAERGRQHHRENLHRNRIPDRRAELCPRSSGQSPGDPAAEMNRRRQPNDLRSGLRPGRYCAGAGGGDRPGSHRAGGQHQDHLRKHRAQPLPCV